MVQVSSALYVGAVAMDWLAGARMGMGGMEGVEYHLQSTQAGGGDMVKEELI